MTLVTVLTPSGRRQNVKCTQNYTILQILEEVCEKHGFKAEEYDLIHHNHKLDTTSTIRFSGIPNNAFLEMALAKNARAESKVTLGLQLENGERIVGSFDPSDSLYFVLCSLVPEQMELSLNPVIIYTRHEVYGENNLKNTTLRRLGLTSGRAVLRLIHRTPEQLRVQANVSTLLPVKPKAEDVESPPLKIKKNEITFSHEQSNNASDIVQQALKRPPEKTENEVSNGTLNSAMDNFTTNSRAAENKKIEDEIHIIGERNAIVFLHQCTKLPILEELPDEFYELTINEVKYLLKDLQRNVRELEDAPLVSANTLKFENDKKILRQLNMYRKTIIRIQFPNQIVLQGAFQPLEKVHAVIQFVRNYLQNADQEFYLFSAPPKEILNPNTSLLEANCVPSVLLYFGTKCEHQDKKSFLKPDILSKFTSFEGAQHVATKLRNFIRKEVLDSSSASQ